MLPVMRARFRELSVNVDHVATVRQARQEKFPDPVELAVQAESGGANGITCHLRSDRRHIQDDDVKRLKEKIAGELNLEMAATDEMLAIALAVMPAQVSLVPERPEEVTTQGGLDLRSRFDDIKPYAEKITGAGIRLSFFIEAEKEMIELAQRLGASRVEFNTDHYAKAFVSNPAKASGFVDLFREMAELTGSLGMETHIGHALDYDNIGTLMEIREISGASIGFAIVARALVVGMEQAVEEMIKLMRKDST